MMNNILCFHNPDEENGYLSNWYPSKFTYADKQFSSMEQYMMYRKAVCFNDEKIAAEILETDDVATIKALGRQVSGYDDNVWNGIRQIAVYEGLLAKFFQNEELRRQLIATDDAILAECAVRDQIWGIGLSMTDSDRKDITKWKGQNLLGYALMMARDKLKGYVDSVRLEMIADIEMNAPSYDEQKKISDYLSNLDNLITLQQRKLEKLQNIKKSMLGKMFV